MKLFTLVKKTLLENLRDWKITSLTLTFAPFFVVLMFYYFEGAMTTYRILLINHDTGTTTDTGQPVNAGKDLVAALEAVRSKDGRKMLKVKLATDLHQARQALKQQKVDLAVRIPENFSRILVACREDGNPAPALIESYGNPDNIKYMMAAVWADMTTYQLAVSATGKKGPIELKAHSIGDAKSLNDFDQYMPGLLSLAFIILMFTAAASLIKEKDKGTIIRLRLSRITASEWLLSISLVQLVIGILSLFLTYLTAHLLGYQARGTIWPLLVVSLLSCLSIVAISIVVAAWLRTIFDLMTIGCFPFFILMFFSGAMFPLPKLSLFSLGPYSVNINDILPVTHSMSALGKILNHGAGLEEVLFELAAILILTVLYATIGILWFTRRHLKAQ